MFLTTVGILVGDSVGFRVGTFWGHTDDLQVITCYQYCHFNERYACLTLDGFCVGALVGFWVGACQMGGIHH